MLVLAHANGLGVDLDELGQGVLQAPGNAGRAAQAHIDIGHFLAGEFTGRVHRSARFADHHLLDVCAIAQFDQLLDQVAGQFVGFTAGGAVANGNQVDLVLFAQLGEGKERAFPVLARFVRVYGGGIDQLAGRIDHGHFHTRADARVQPHHHARASRCCQQQVAQVVTEHLDGDFFSVFAQTREEVAFGRQTELDAPSPGHAFADQVVRGARCVAPAQMQGDLAFCNAGFAQLGLGANTGL